MRLKRDANGELEIAQSDQAEREQVDVERLPAERRSSTAATSRSIPATRSSISTTSSSTVDAAMPFAGPARGERESARPTGASARRRSAWAHRSTTTHDVFEVRSAVVARRRCRCVRPRRADPEEPVREAVRRPRRGARPGGRCRQLAPEREAAGRCRRDDHRAGPTVGSRRDASRTSPEQRSASPHPRRRHREARERHAIRRSSRPRAADRRQGRGRWPRATSRSTSRCRRTPSFRRPTLGSSRRGRYGDSPHVNATIALATVGEQITATVEATSEAIRAKHRRADPQAGRAAHARARAA